MEKIVRSAANRSAKDDRFQIVASVARRTRWSGEFARIQHALSRRENSNSTQRAIACGPVHVLRSNSAWFVRLRSTCEPGSSVRACASSGRAVT